MQSQIFCFSLYLSIVIRTSVLPRYLTPRLFVVGEPLQRTPTRHCRAIAHVH